MIAKLRINTFGGSSAGPVSDTYVSLSINNYYTLNNYMCLLSTINNTCTVTITGGNSLDEIGMQVGAVGNGYSEVFSNEITLSATPLPESAGQLQIITSGTNFNYYSTGTITAIINNSSQIINIPITITLSNPSIATLDSGCSNGIGSSNTQCSVSFEILGRTAESSVVTLSSPGYESVSTTIYIVPQNTLVYVSTDDGFGDGGVFVLGCPVSKSEYYCGWQQPGNPSADAAIGNGSYDYAIHQMVVDTLGNVYAKDPLFTYELPVGTNQWIQTCNTSPQTCNLPNINPAINGYLTASISGETVSVYNSNTESTVVAGGGNVPASVSAVAVGSDGSVYAGTYNGYLYKASALTGSWVNLGQPDGDVQITAIGLH